MEIIGISRHRQLLSQQVSDGRYFFLDLRPLPRKELGVSLGGRERCSPDYLLRRDRYPYHVLEIVADGEGWAEFDGCRHELRPGVIFGFGPETRCVVRTDARRPLVKYFFALAGTVARRRLTRAGLGPGQTRMVMPVAEIGEVAEELIREGQQEDAAAREICGHLFEVMLLKIERVARRPSPAHEPARDRFLRCKALIDQEAEKLNSLREVARQAGIEQSSICRLFRRYHGTSPYQYLLRRKMNLAAEHLMTRGGLVKQAAERVGFEDAFHFSRVFKATHGVSPREVRRFATVD